MHSFEYEVITDANIVGEIDFDMCYLTIWYSPGLRRRGQSRFLCLRIKNPYPLPPLIPTEAMDFLSRASLFLRRRLVLSSLTRCDDKPSRYDADDHQTIMPPPSGHYIDVDIVRDPATNLADLKEWLEMVDKLDTNKRERFDLAARLYSQALEIMEIRPDLGYLNLVSAIETLAVDVDVGAPSLDDLSEGWEDLVNKIADTKLRQEITNKLVEDRFFTRKFCTFIEKCMEKDKDFWTYERRPKGPGRIMEKSLPKLLRKIYKQRSETLHSGKPFPFYVFQRTALPSLEQYSEEIWLEKKTTVHYNEMDEIPSHSMIVMPSGGTWAAKDFIPYPHFFERLVNHALKNYLRANQQAIGY